MILLANTNSCGFPISDICTTQSLVRCTGHRHFCTYTHTRGRLPSRELPTPPTGSLKFRPLTSNLEFGQLYFFCFPVTVDRGNPRSNISTTLGHPDTRFCVCENPRGELSHITSLTSGCSRSDFFRSIRRAQDHTCGGRTDTGNRLNESLKNNLEKAMCAVMVLR